jgi:hypothetical protein
MTAYHFDLVTLDRRIPDSNGTELPDEASAREHARQVACELMLHQEPRTRAMARGSHRFRAAALFRTTEIEAATNADILETARLLAEADKMLARR